MAVVMEAKLSPKGGEYSVLLAEIKAEYEKQAIKPPANDKRIAAYSLAALNQIENGDFGAILEDILHFRQLFKVDGDPIKPSHLHNLVLRGLQSKLMHTDPDYPELYDTEEKWEEIIRSIPQHSKASNIGWDSFYANMYFHQPQSNIDERYKAFKLFMLLNRERFGDYPTILDVGCSQNHGLKKMNSRQYGFGAIKVIKTSSTSGEIGQPEIDYSLTKVANALLAARFFLGICIGIDAVHKDDQAAIDWARSCSFYPSELLDKDKVREYDGLVKEAHPNVGFYNEDFTALDLEDFSKAVGIDKFDVVTFSTVLYQLGESKREAMRKMAEHLVKPKGFILYQDFADVDSNDHNHMTYRDSWFEKDFLYTTIYQDMLDPGKLHEVFSWDNGRCGKLRLLGDTAISHRIRLLAS